MKNIFFAMQLWIFSFPLTTVKALGSSLEPYPLGFGGLKWSFLRPFDCGAIKVLSIFRLFSRFRDLVGSNGLGPSTSRLSGVCSNQLSYEPMMVEVIGFEPMTPCLQGRCSTSWAIPPSYSFHPVILLPCENKCSPLQGKHALIKNE